MDGPVVGQSKGRNAFQPGGHFGPVLADGLVAEIARSHHERPGEAFFSQQGEQRGVQRRIGQHHAQPREPGGRFRELFSAAAQHNYRGLRGRQRGGFRVGDGAEFAGGRERRHHHGERFMRPALCGPQLFQRGRVVGAAGQVEAAEALQRTYPAGYQQLGGPLQGGGAVQSLSRALEPYRRAADGAGVGLGVKAPVQGVRVLAPAVGAHLKARHRGGGAVVRHAFDYGEARAAIGAVGERVEVPSVGGIQQFPAAVGAEREVGRDDGGGGGLAAAFGYGESSFAGRGYRAADQGIHPGRRGPAGRDGFYEGFHRRGPAFGFYGNSGSVVLYPAAQLVLGGELIDVRAEAYALHHAFNEDVFSYRGSHYLPVTTSPFL